MIESSNRLKPWRNDVGREATIAMRGESGMALGPVWVALDFTFDRPKSHFRTGKYASLRRQTAPASHTTKPDLDKLVRAACDALTGIVWQDDSQVHRISASKRYVDSVDGQPGCWVRITYSNVLPG
jgi:Holliday junction resolvase RusA-like endonuclease